MLRWHHIHITYNPGEGVHVYDILKFPSEKIARCGKILFHLSAIVLSDKFTSSKMQDSKLSGGVDNNLLTEAQN